MDPDRVELIRGLFAAATEMIEHLHEEAMAGQAVHKRSDRYLQIARRMTTAARDLETVAEAAQILATKRK